MQAHSCRCHVAQLFPCCLVLTMRWITRVVVCSAATKLPGCQKSCEPVYQSSVTIRCFHSELLTALCIRYLPGVVRHCLEVFGQLVPVAQGQADAPDSSDDASQQSSNLCYALDQQQVCWLPLDEKLPLYKISNIKVTFSKPFFIKHTL